MDPPELGGRWNKEILQKNLQALKTWWETHCGAPTFLLLFKEEEAHSKPS